MNWKLIVSAAVIPGLLLSGSVSEAKKRKDKKEAATTVMPLVPPPPLTVDLPEGVHNVPGFGLCRERPPKPPAPRPRPRLKGAVEGAVTVLSGTKPSDDASNVVVYIEGAPGQRPSPIGHMQILQRDLSFVPEVNVVTVGTTIDFPNQDHVFHNIFSVSAPGKFDLGLYKAGDSRSFTFTKPGDVDVYCNIHPQMVSKIKILDTRYYAVTGRDGKFRIDDVPEGKYKIFAWQAQSDEVEDDIEVRPSETTQHAVQLKLGRGTGAHLRKDGTPYGRYK